jgi:hypothetical protein
VWFGLVCLGIAARECWREFGVSVFSLCISLYQTFFSSYKYNDTQFSCVFEKKEKKEKNTPDNLAA